jgi:predicted FMN-binding regulatory protein PaiB
VEKVGFEIEITAIEGKFKLSQNRTGADRPAALAGATKHYAESNPDLVRMMKAALK